MRNHNIKLLCLTVLLPLVLGTLLYILLPGNNLHFIRNYLPDGLWSFSFTSCLLLIWSGKIHIFWFAVAAAVSSLFEYLQWSGEISGTGDPLDILAYFISALAAIYIHRIKIKIHDNKN